jgi:type II secretory pathway pseudopilin PulG
MELLIVVFLMGITTAMFATVYGTTVKRSSQVQAQNIAQTEVRASLNQLVADLRNATTGGRTPPVLSYSASSIVFYSPDRMAQRHLRKISYSLSSDNVLRRQVSVVTSYDSNGNPIDPGNTGPINTVATIQAPLTGDPANGGWAKGQIFKYCVQSPPNMTIDPSNATSPELITWSCETPTSAATIKTVVMRAVVSPIESNEKFSYGAVATMRWNAS